MYEELLQFILKVLQCYNKKSGMDGESGLIQRCWSSN